MAAGSAMGSSGLAPEPAVLAAALAMDAFGCVHGRKGARCRCKRPGAPGAASGIQAQRLLIIDFGSQYTQLIARRVRRLESIAKSSLVTWMRKRWLPLAPRASSSRRPAIGGGVGGAGTARGLVRSRCAGVGHLLRNAGHGGPLRRCRGTFVKREFGPARSGCGDLPSCCPGWPSTLGAAWRFG